MRPTVPTTRAVAPARPPAAPMPAPPAPLHARTARAAAAAAAAALLTLGAPFEAAADLNRLEAAAGGEFGRGTALQFGEAMINGKSFDGQDLTRSNFTSAEARNTSFKKAKLVGAFFMKGNFYRADFTGANLDDALFDRAVLVEASFKDAVVRRVVFTSSDLHDAVVENADFSFSLIDRSQQQALCRYASGTNPVTGVDTRKSLGCGSRRRRLESTPSNPDAPTVDADEREAFTKTLSVYRQ